MTRMRLDSLHDFYRRQLFDEVLPFWMKRGIDRKLGGFFTCFSNRGDRLLHPHKFTWSQGRFVWVLSRLAREFKGRRPEAEIADYLGCAGAGARFLMKHARLPSGSCAFILSEQGEPILLNPDGTARKAGPGEVYDTSVYADLFVVYGIAEYAMAAGDRQAYDFAADLYDSAMARFLAPVYHSDPYPVPPGYEAHGRPMILCETAHEMAQAAEHFRPFDPSTLRPSFDPEVSGPNGQDRTGGTQGGPEPRRTGRDPRKDAFLTQAGQFMAEVMDKFRDPKTNVILEMHSADPAKRETMLGTYVNPGHMLESMWFVIHLAERLGMKGRIAQAIEVIRAACRVGWDEEHGGFFQFAHRDGGAPRGPVPPELADAEMIRKLRGNWDNKLWWPHSEALYALLLGYRHSRAEDLLDWYWKAHDYAFGVFPNPDRSIGEWIHIRDRSGAPVDKVVALPVKDPFHVPRAFILCIQLLEEMETRTNT